MRGSVVSLVVLVQVMLAATAFSYTSETVWEDGTNDEELALDESQVGISDPADDPWIGSNYCAAKNDPETSPYVTAEDVYCDDGESDPKCPPWDCDSAPDPGSTVVTVEEIGDVAGSQEGCKTVNVGVHQYTWNGSYAWTFHQEKYWCWDRPRITQVSVGTYIHIDQPDTCCFVYHGIPPGGSSGHYYRWLPERNRSGHYSFRQGEVANCLARYGCISTKYPWVRIWAHADGSWRARRGGTDDGD